MVPLDPATSAGLAGSHDMFGPTAMLLVGFSPEETARVAFLLESLGATDHVRLVPATAATLAGTLREAMEGDGGDGPAGASSTSGASPVLPGTPRAVFLSGFYSAEVVDLIAAWREDASPPLPEPVWAAAVPNNYDRAVGELVEAVVADDREMRARRAGGGE